MTFIAIEMHRDRAIVAHDSFGYDNKANIRRYADGRPIQFEKILVVAHGHFVLVGRGASELFLWLHRQLTTCDSVDAVSDALTGLLTQARHLFNLASAGRYNNSDEVYVLGWSARQDQMVMVDAGSDVGFADFVRPRAQVCSEYEKRAVYALRAPPLLPVAHLDTPEKMFEYARGEIEHARSDDVYAPYGGKLVVAQIDRTGIKVTVAGDLGAPPTREEAELTMRSKTVGALLLSAAAAACGGSEETPQGDQIADNAATTPISYFAASTSLSASGATSASSNIVTPVSGSYVNNFPYTVYLEMFVTCEAVVTTPAAGGNWLMQGSYAVLSAGGSTLDARTVGFLTGVSPQPGAISAISYLVALAPGQTFSYSVRGGVGSTSAAVTVAFNNATIRVNVIKK